MSPFSVAILTVSDTAFHSGPSFDRSGPALRAYLAALPASPYTVITSEIVADEPKIVRQVVQRWCEEGVDLVLTTGGTGFGVRDSTPEALTPLINKPAPGMVTLMLEHSFKITPLAALSRPVAGVCVLPAREGKGTIIISLPGSPKGATENFEALLKVLPHALELASGGTGEETHAQLGNSLRGESTGGAGAEAPKIVRGGGGHLCSHDHGSSASGGHTIPVPRTMLSQDPSAAAASRQRHSPYPMVPVRDAMSIILEQVRVARVLTLPVDEGLLGFVLAEDVVALKNIPERPTTNVDGYAVRSSDPIGVYQVQTTYGPVAPGFIYRINTGAPLPLGTDAVIMVEDTEVFSRHQTGANGEEGDEKEVKVLAQVNTKENTREGGSDVKEGEKVLESGDVISATGGELGTLAFIGQRSARVHRRPVIAVLSTGNELVDLQDTSATSSSSSFSLIPDSNRPSLISILRHLHFEVIDLGIVADTMAATTNALKKGKEQADVILTTGGTSMGVGDLLKPCLEREMKGTIHFGRVALKPGKPTTFATIPAHPMAPNPNPRLVFALPGNPAGALVTFFLFVLPSLRKMEGRRQSEWELPRVRVSLSNDLRLDSRPEYQRVSVRPSNATSGHSLQAFSTGGQRSSRTVSLAGANGLLELPARTDLKSSYAIGDEVQCVLIGELSGI